MILLFIIIYHGKSTFTLNWVLSKIGSAIKFKIFNCLWFYIYLFNVFIVTEIRIMNTNFLVHIFCQLSANFFFIYKFLLHFKILMLIFPMIYSVFLVLIQSFFIDIFWLIWVWNLLKILMCFKMMLKIRRIIWFPIFMKWILVIMLRIPNLNLNWWKYFEYFKFTCLSFKGP